MSDWLMQKIRLERNGSWRWQSMILSSAPTFGYWPARSWRPHRKGKRNRPRVRPRTRRVLNRQSHCGN